MHMMEKSSLKVDGVALYDQGKGGAGKGTRPNPGYGCFRHPIPLDYKSRDLDITVALERGGSEVVSPLVHAYAWLGEEVDIEG
jgi:hypothetical protein